MIKFFALAHMVGATQHHVPGTCTHDRCYENIMFLALAHLVGATQHHASCTCTHGRCYATSCFLHLHTWSVLRNIMGWGGDDNVLCTCTHGWCYAESCSWHLHTWSVLRNIMFLALAHMVGATQHHGVGLGWGGVGMITFIALAHMVGATEMWLTCSKRKRLTVMWLGPQIHCK